MPTVKTALLAGLLIAAHPATAADPVGMLGLPTGGGALSKIPGIGGLFGDSDKAKESTQLAHMAMHEAGNAKRLAELLKSNENWVRQLMTMAGPIAGSDISEFGWLLDELSRVQKDMTEIVYDPTGYGSYEKYSDFVRMQQARSANRLEKIAIGMKALEDRVETMGGRTSELMAANANAQGGIEAQQISNELAGIKADAERQQLMVMADILRAQNEQEARQLENQLLSEQRWCGLMPDLESCGGATP